MSALTQKVPIALMQTQWASQINPIINNALVQGQILTDISLANGVTTINHKLGRKMIGWYIVDITGAATVYRSQPLNALTLTLTSNAAVTVALWVF